MKGRLGLWIDEWTILAENGRDLPIPSPSIAVSCRLFPLYLALMVLLTG